jgi:hypothetical protein
LKISVNYQGQYKAKLTLTPSTKLKTPILKYKYKTIENTNTPIVINLKFLIWVSLQICQFVIALNPYTHVFTYKLSGSEVKLKISVNYRGQYEAKNTYYAIHEAKEETILKYKYKTIENTNTPS